MKRQLLFLVTAIALTLLSAAQSTSLPRSTPAAEGISTQAVINMMDTLMAIPNCDIHHVMVLRHGKVVAELHPAPFRGVDSHTLYSASKTFTSLAVGMAIDENRLRLTDRVASFFPDKMPDSIAADLASVTVRDLLMMAAGIKPDWPLRDNSEDWVRDWLSQRCNAQPGTLFQYDSMCTFMLAAIVQRVTGRNMKDYLNDKLLFPMGVTDAEWEMSPDGIATGGWGLRVTSEVMAKLGVLLCNKGNWNGRQLVSAGYVEQACSGLIACGDHSKPKGDGNSGYGYQVWQCKRPGAFRADGAFGQYSVAIPDKDMVVVIMGMVLYGHSELAAIWDILLPGVQDAPLKPEPKLQNKLDKLLATATLPLPQGKSGGKRLPGGLLQLQPNKYGLQWISLSADGLRFGRADGTQEHYAMGCKQWRYSPVNGFPPYSITAMNRMQDLTHNFTAATAYAWTSPTTLEVKVHYVNWISGTTFKFDFGKNTVTVCDNFPTSKPETISFQIVK